MDKEGDKKPEDNSSVDNLRRGLYTKDEPQEVVRRIKKLREPKAVEKSQLLKDNAHEPQLVSMVEQRAQKRRKILLWSAVAAGVVVVFLAAAGVTAWYRASRQVSEDDIGLGIQAPTEFTAGEEITYTLTYKNNSRVAWQNVEIGFTPPEGFLFRESTPQAEKSGQQYVMSVGELAAQEEGSVQIVGQLIGEQSTSVLARSEMTISPENFPKARISTSETFTTTIVSVPLEVAVEATKNAASGERVIVRMKVRNTSSNVVAGSLLRLTPAPAVQLATEDETFSAEFSVPDSWWELPDLQPLEEVERVAVVYAEGSPGEKRGLEVEALVRIENNVFVQRTVSHIVSLAASELSVSQTFDKNPESFSVEAEQEIAATVEYSNVGTTGLKNVIVSVAFEGTGIDPATIDLDAGAYNPTTRTITWTSATVPELTTLQPGQTGSLEYAFSLLPTAELQQEEEPRNQNLIVAATIDSPDLPTPNGQERRIITDRAVFPIRSLLTVDVDSFYDDGRLGLTSTGPLPPEVGEETLYTVRFRLRSSMNDVGDVQLVAVLPDGVRYVDNIYKTVGEVEFNERNGEILWSVPLIEGLSGFTGPGPELHAQVGITPGENLRGDVVPLVRSARVEGLDVFAEETVGSEAEELPDTETASPQNGDVQ